MCIELSLHPRLHVHDSQVLHVRVCSTQQSAQHMAALLAAAYQLYAIQVMLYGFL